VRNLYAHGLQESEKDSANFAINSTVARTEFPFEECHPETRAIPYISPISVRFCAVEGSTPLQLVGAPLMPQASAGKVIRRRADSRCGTS